MTPSDLLTWASTQAGFTSVPADSCVAFAPDRPVTRIASAINATTGDLLLARQLGCDAFLLHHPLAGSASREFYKVLDRMVELLLQHGVDHQAAANAVQPLRTRIRFRDHASDWSSLQAAAELLDLPLFNIHLPADEFGRRAMVDAVSRLTPSDTLADLEKALQALPELTHPANEFIRLTGDPDRPIGRVAVMHAGGTNGGASVANALFDAGIGTVVYIHIAGEETPKLVDENRGHLLITGHFASDALGINLLMRRAAEHFGVQFVPMGGLLPFSSPLTHGC